MSLLSPRTLVWRDGATYALRQVYTQTNAGGGTVIIDIIPAQGTEFEIMFLTLGPDDYAANRTVVVRIYDGEATPNLIAQLLTLASDNIKNTYPHKVGDSDRVTLAAMKGVMISGTDQLSLQVQSLVQNETFTIALRLRIKNAIPTIVRTRSTGTVGAPITTYEEVI